MSKSFVSLCLLRVIYPICLTACVSCRQDLITSIFLIFLLYLPFVPVPTPRTMSGHTGSFLKLNFIISTVTLCLQVIFQIFLLIFRHYGKIISENCGEWEKIFRHIGFVRYGYSLSLWNTALHIAPEVIAIFSSFFVYVFCDRLNPACPDSEQLEEGLLASIIRTPVSGREARRSLMKKKGLLALAIIGKYLSLVMLCFASILVPSFTSGFLYVVFLCCVTYWACYKDLGRNFAYLCRFLCIIVFLYIVAIFVYQTEWIQELLPPTSELPINFGLQALRLTNCSVDARAYITNPTLTWPSFVLPYALILLFYLLICESGLLLFVSALHKRLLEGSDVRGPNETTPLIRGRESVYRRSNTTGMSQDSQGSITINNSPEEKVDPVGDETNEGEESFKVDIMEYLVDAFITLISFITRTSYIGTNIIMMTWSITYHSWLTFFLLLGAIVLWMVPNQRQSMLRISPFLVAYAIFLLLTQYLFDLDFINEELVELHLNVSAKDREQIGFPKSDFPVKELAIKTLFTVMFWITMRQYMSERQESRSTSTVAHMLAPVQVTVGTATAIGGDPASRGGQIMQKFGERVRKLLTKFWIWVVTITLFAIGILGDQMNLFRILYMALALVFVLTFQLSWVLWRKIMYGFWLVVIVTSMTILVMIYTFQFDAIKDLWEKIGVNETWQEYIGLEKKSAGDLFLFLIVPTFFVIITVIQLKYFHKDFLIISDIRSRGTSTNRPKSRPSILSDDEYTTQVEDVSSKTEPPSPEDVPSPSSSKSLVDPKNIDLQPSRPSFHVFGRAPNDETLQTLDKINLFIKDSVEIFWMFMELHIKKFILTLIMVICIYEVDVIHFGFVVGAVLAMMLNAALQDIVIRLTSVGAAVVLLVQMIFQIKHFTVDDWAVTCEVDNNRTFQLYGTDWLGLYKTGPKSMLQLLSGYIWIIVAVTMYVVVITRQKYVRHVKGRPLSRSHVLFPQISYREANNGILECIQYLFNYGFYRFGIEITLISMVFLIGNRLDVIALIYAVWLIVIVVSSRATLSKIWYILNLFIAISIPLQYTVGVGLPPQFCFKSFQKQGIISRALEWLFIPVNSYKPDITLLLYDFIVLLFVTRQTKVFRTEYQHKDNDYPGGSNKSIVHEMENPNYVNPIPDFISDKKSYLDIIKHGVLCSLLWISCAVAFLAGTTNVTVFSFGYVIGSFLILWQGNDFYLRPINAILKWWNRFLIYNVSIIFLKAFFQIPGCIFWPQMESVCWLVKLLGIGCIKEFGFLDSFLGNGSTSSVTCSEIISIDGMGGDAACFILLLLQKRLFSSHYFIRIVDEAKAMAVLAARGAELIEELSRKQILKQQELEKAELKKIKNKMDSIKAAQKKIQGIKSKEITTHAEAIRSGDYYMFDDEESFNLVHVDELTAVDELDEELHGKTLGKLMESVLRTDLKHALKSKAPDGHGDEPMKSPSTKSRSEMASKSTSSSAGDGDDEEDDNDSSTYQHKSTDATTSKDVSDSFDGSSLSLRRSKRGSDRKRTSFHREDRERRERDKDKDDTSESEDALTSGDDEDSQPIQSCWDSFMTYFRFARAFINSCMISMIHFLNRKSRDHRYVIHALEREKKTLKETRNLRMGMRIQPEMKWQPVPTGLGSQRSKSPLKMEDFESQGLVASSQPVFVRLLLAIYHALMSHSDMVCYFAVFILQIKSPTLASLPLSLMVFFWGTLSMPRPTKRFWVTIIAYTEFIVVVRNICQADFMSMDPIPDDKPFYWPRILGVEKNSNDSFYNLVLLLAVFFHRSTLKSLGLWKSAEEFNKDNKTTDLLNLNYVEPHRLSVVSGSDSDVVTELTTVNMNVPEQLRSEDGVHPSTESYQNQTTVPRVKVNSCSLSSSSENLLEPYTKIVTDFFNKLIDSKSRIADDVYAYMFFCDFLNIIVIIFGFSSFGAAKGDGGVTQYIEDNKIPIAFLVMVIIQFALIVVDRWLYLSRYIVGKLVFQYLLVVVIHIWMFFILPAVTERRFNDALPPSLWYLIKCFYLLLSAYQIRSGYPSRILGNFLSKNYNLVNMVLFKVFMLIPFVYELRTLMDWIWTETSMTLTDWIKMEDIFAQIFQLKCLRRAEYKYPLPSSQKIPAKTKFLYGAGGLGVLFTIIWFPLVLFALGNTVGEPNIPTDMYAKVQISSYQALYNTYTSKVSSLGEAQWKEIKDVYSSSASASTFLSDYNPEDVGVVTLPTYSSSIWTIPPPEMTEIVTELNACSEMRISLEWTINRRSENPESPKTVAESNFVPLSNDICQEMNNVLNSTSSDNNVTIPYLMPKFLKVTSIGKASPVSKLMKNQDQKRNLDGSDSGTSPFINITFRLEKDKTTGDKWWSAFESIDSDPSLLFLETIDDITTNHTGTRNKSLIIYTFNDKMFPPGLLSIISGKGIIGLYTTFVIVVGAYVKGYFTGTSGQIMFEDMPYVDRILQLCLDIYLVRERREFDLEEDLFAKLLFLYRSPETIIKWTRPPEDGGPEVY